MKKPLRPDTHGRHTATAPGRQLPTPPRRPVNPAAPGTGAKTPTAVGKAPIAPGSPEPGAGAGLPMPHERDESVGQVAAAPDPVIRQAFADLEAGRVDTDLRATPGLDAKRRDEPLSRGAH